MEEKSEPAPQKRAFFKKLKHPSSFSKPQLLVFVLAFGLIGYLLYKTFAAAPVVATLQAEQMSLPAGGSVISDSTASAGKAVQLTANGTATGSVNFPSSVTSLTVMARGVQCSGAPTMTVALDKTNLLTNTAVSATSWTAYSYTPVSAIASGTHNLSISFNNAYSSHGHGKKGNGACSRNLFIDVTNFYGPTTVTPAPTVALSASPTSVTSGQSSTLTWTSTNATSCTASGAWSGSEPTAGSLSTGALNQTSTYSLTCTGSGGSATAGATVTVTAPGSSISVTPPTPPSPYTVPSGATLVSNTAQLKSALSAGAVNIELADGTYDNGSPFEDNAGSHLYAQHLGMAILKSGIVTGGNGSANGSILQGLAFNISTAAEALGDGGAYAAVNTWGSAGANTQVLDCTFEGNKVVSMGLYAYNPAGLVAQRDYFHNFLDEGIRASNNSHVAYGGTTAKINSISDISVDGVSESSPGASDGTAEAGVWVGAPVINGVHRIKVRNVSISGIETVNNSWDTTFSDLDIDMSGPNYSSGVGVYMEHFTLHDIFTNFKIVGSGIGFNAEWDDGTLGNAAAHFDTIENGTINSAGSPVSSTVGIDLDDGTDSTTVNNVTFDNQTFAGIVAYQNNKEGGGTNVYINNTYNLAPGAVQISTSHF